MTDSHRIHALVLLAISWVAAGPSQAATLVLGPNGAPGDTHTTLQAAVNAAANDDTILILPGTYPGGAFMPFKRLTIVGSGASSTTIESLREPQPFGGSIDTLTIRDVRIVPLVEAMPFGSNSTAYPGIDIVGGNALVVEDCIIDASMADGTSPVPAVILRGALRASFARCVLRGGNGHISVSSSTPPTAHNGEPALVLNSDSQGNAGRVALTACDLFGGIGFDHTGWPKAGGSGGDGMRLTRGEATAIGSTFQGANTGPGMSLGAGDDGTGVPGAGVRVHTGATLIHQASTFAAGVDTFPGMSPSPAPVLLSGGAATAIPGVPATLSTSGKTPVGSTASISISGAPGAGAALLVGAPFPFVDVPLVFGPLGLTPSVIIVQPNLPASGTFSFGAPVPPLPPGLSSASIAMQAYVAPFSGGPFSLSNLSVFTAVIPGL